jgi:hypothetical protein
MMLRFDDSRELQNTETYTIMHVKPSSTHKKRKKKKKKLRTIYKIDHVIDGLVYITAVLESQLRTLKIIKKQTLKQKKKKKKTKHILQTRRT